MIFYGKKRLEKLLQIYIYYIYHYYYLKKIIIKIN